MWILKGSRLAFSDINFHLHTVSSGIIIKHSLVTAATTTDCTVYTGDQKHTQAIISLCLTWLDFLLFMFK